MELPAFRADAARAAAGCCDGIGISVCLGAFGVRPIPAGPSPRRFERPRKSHAEGDRMRLTTRSLVSSVACLGLSAFLIGPALAQTDPQVGVWKLNPAKSKYSPGPAIKSGTTTIEAAGAGTKVIVEQALADGTVRHFEFTADYDGKDSPVTGNNPDMDTV